MQGIAKLVVHVKATLAGEDSAETHVDRPRTDGDQPRVDQEIRVQNADAALINATESLAVVKNQSLSDVEIAELTLEFSKQDLKQYEKGLYPNEKTASENAITLREEELQRAEETLVWSKKLSDCLLSQVWRRNGGKIGFSGTEKVFRHKPAVNLFAQDWKRIFYIYLFKNIFV